MCSFKFKDMLRRVVTRDTSQDTGLRDVTEIGHFESCHMTSQFT